MLLSNALLEFNRDYIEGNNLSKKTQECYGWCFHQFMQVCGDLHVEDITNTEISLWKEYARQKGNTPTTIAGNISRMRVFITWCNERNLNSHIIGHKMPIPKKPRSTKPNYLTEDEVNKIISSCITVRDKAIIATLFSSGIRSAELRNLKVNDYNQYDRVIHVKLGKGMKERWPLLSPRACDLINLYQMTRLESEWLFSTQKGQQIAPSTLRYILQYAGERAGIDKHVHPHLLRHSCGTHYLNNGGTIREVQDLLGHEHVSTTEIYTHVVDEHKRETHMLAFR